MTDSTPAPEGAFSDLIQPLRKAIAIQQYTTPTPIQEQCMPAITAGRDLLGSAQTGTGKTAAFTLPLLQRLHQAKTRPGPSAPRGLILAPTRELAMQIEQSLRTYGRFLKLRHTVVVGGVPQRRQVQALQRGVDILVATPGRLLDLVEQSVLFLDSVEVFVLDEVDRMLDMGFIPDIRRILRVLPEERQTLFFSATLPKKVASLAEEMVSDPVRVVIEPDKPTVERIQQKVLFVGQKDKDSLLVSLLSEPGIEKAIVFIQMKHAANRLVSTLSTAGIRGTAIHGNKSQAARTKALDGFKRGRFKVLVATDVAARGLDVDDITHVFNYDLPQEPDTYVHRIGRTGRAGAAGDAISFCSAADRALLRDIERRLGAEVPVEADHAYHCEVSRHSTRPRPTPGGKARRGGMGPSRGRRPQGQRSGRPGHPPRTGRGAPAGRRRQKV